LPTKLIQRNGRIRPLAARRLRRRRRGAVRDTPVAHKAPLPAKAKRRKRRTLGVAEPPELTGQYPLGELVCYFAYLDGITPTACLSARSNLILWNGWHAQPTTTLTNLRCSMDIIEPPHVFAERLSQRPLYNHHVIQGPVAPLVRRFAPVTANEPLGDNFWSAALVEAVGEAGDDGIRITSLVNEVVRQGHYASRDHRNAAKVRLFRLVGRLLRMGLLRRFARKYVVVTPQPSPEAIRQPAMPMPPIDLPAPNL